MLGSGASPGAASITIVIRDPTRGSELVALLNRKTQARADLVGWDRAYRIPEASDIVVNATSIGLFPHVEGRLDLDLDSLRPGLVVADVIPNPPANTADPRCGSTQLRRSRRPWHVGQPGCNQYPALDRN